MTNITKPFLAVVGLIGVLVAAYFIDKNKVKIMESLGSIIKAPEDLVIPLADSK